MVRLKPDTTWPEAQAVCGRPVRMIAKVIVVETGSLTSAFSRKPTTATHSP